MPKANRKVETQRVAAQQRPVRERLDAMRREAGLTWRQVAEQAGVDPERLARWNPTERLQSAAYEGVVKWLEGGGQLVPVQPANAGEPSRNLPLPATDDDAAEWLYLEILRIAERRGMPTKLRHVHAEGELRHLGPAVMIAANALRMAYGLPVFVRINQ
jgi:transcriptional regulator with XRE-family HTH domain